MPFPFLPNAHFHPAPLPPLPPLASLLSGAPSPAAEKAAFALFHSAQSALSPTRIQTTLGIHPWTVSQLALQLLSAAESPAAEPPATEATEPPAAEAAESHAAEAAEAAVLERAQALADRLTAILFPVLQNVFSFTAISGVGEIGLDFSPGKTPHPFCRRLQSRLFSAQYQCALRLRRPVIVHAVKAIDPFLSVYKSNPPPKGLLFHRFQGSPEQLNQLLNALSAKANSSPSPSQAAPSCSPSADGQLFFSFSPPPGFPNRPLSAKTAAALSACPLSSLLIEEETFFPAAETPAAGGGMSAADRGAAAERGTATANETAADVQHRAEPRAASPEAARRQNTADGQKSADGNAFAIENTSAPRSAPPPSPALIAFYETVAALKSVSVPFLIRRIAKNLISFYT